MRDWFLGPLPWLLGAMIVAGLVVYVWLLGSAVVVDETKGVLIAAVVDGHGREQSLHRIADGYFYVIPDLEGAVEVRCKDGARKRWGYVTPNMHTKVRVQGDKPCAQLVNG